MKLGKIKFLFLLLTFYTISQARVIIWDFGGVLFQPNKLGVARSIGLSYFISHMLLDFKNPNVQARIFKVLESMPAKHKDDWARAGTAEGEDLPPIMCDWQSGATTGLEIIKQSKEHIKKLAASKFFVSYREQILIQKTIEAMFDPQILANNIDDINEGIKLLKDCHEAKYPNGTKKNINIGFSNWDSVSFKFFYQAHKDAFKYFDKIFISGDIGLIKPHKEAFDYVINECGLNPYDIILIDDQKINTSGALASGIKIIRLKNGNYKALRRKLTNEGVL